MDTIQIPVIEVRQNIGELYVGAMKAHDLYAIAKVDRIRLESMKIPKYAGFQRPLVQDRISAIRDYLDTPRCTFPNAIILSLDSEYIENWEDVQGGSNVSTLNVRREEGAAKIIDGQHRSAALDASQQGFEVIVSIFVDLEMGRSAEIFSKINSTQKAVNPSIAFQLFGYAEDRSPQRTAHEIAEIFNTTEGSPFYKRLRMLGTKDNWSMGGTLSQSTFCKELMRLYTRDPTRDENRLLRKEKLDTYSDYPFRDWFIESNDQKILETVWRFFVRIANTWPEQWWDKGGESNLTKTTGYAAFIQILRIWLLNGSQANQVLEDNGVEELFKRIKEKYESPQHRFVSKNYRAGNEGVVNLRDALVKDLKVK